MSLIVTNSDGTKSLSFSWPRYDGESVHCRKCDFDFTPFLPLCSEKGDHVSLAYVRHRLKCDGVVKEEWECTCP